MLACLQDLSAEQRADVSSGRHGTSIEYRRVILVGESATLEPIVIDTIERYFDLLQGHVSAQQMLENVLTDDFETGFADGFRGAERTG